MSYPEELPCGVEGKIIPDLNDAGSPQSGDVLVLVRPLVQNPDPKNPEDWTTLRVATDEFADNADVQQALNAAAAAAQDAASAQQDATQALSDAAAAHLDATAALNALPNKSDKAVTAAGNVGLAVSEVHGSKNNPQSGANITVNITGAIIDTLSRVYHQHSSEPTINVTGSGAGVATKFGAGVYDPNKVNIIGIWYDQNGNVGYGILPEQ